MTQHSPEPWTVEETTSNHYYTRGRKGLQVRVSEYNAIDIPGPMSEESTRANAVLIAAAPDMLAAFMDIQKHVDMSNAAYIRAWEIAEAAIANATGLNPCYDPFPSLPDLLRNSPAEEAKG